ncbi:histidine kinase [Nocardioides sp. MH1]|uniref:sensor histidine kinase n=1 Tax=Nocardioides sp. MH1 TaxID=3242490 RepID=UPI0035227868
MSSSAAPQVEAGASGRVTMRLDAFVARARAAMGQWYFHGLLISTGIFVSWVSTPYQNLTQVPFWTHGFGQWRYVGVFGLLAFVSAPLMLALVLYPRHRSLVAHLRGREADPVEVWRDCVTRLPISAAVVSSVWSGFTIGLGLVYVGRREHFTATTYVGAYSSEALVTVGVAAFYLMIYEVALLPIAREVALQLPPDFADTAVMSARRRLVFLNTAIIFTVGCQAAGLAMGFSQAGRPLVVAVVTLGLVCTYVGAQLALVASSVSRRVAELSDALNAVASGRHAVRIRPSSGDEFDAVGRSFNRMVDLLDDHAQELRRSRSRLIEVADATRRLIERDLHDGAQQNLALVSMQLGQLESGCRAEPEAAERVHAIRAELSEVVAEMRALAHGIYPASLEAEGLTSALRAAARESEVMVSLDVAVRKRWDHAVESAVYFCCWEVLQRVGQVESDDLTVRIGLTEDGGTGLVDIRVQPALPEEHGADLEQYLQDRLGAVGGTVATTPDDHGVAYHADVPTC